MTWSTANYEKLLTISQRLGANPADMLLAMYFESGLNPSAQNEKSGAYGLIQWTPVAYDGSGIKSRSELLQSDVDRQLDFAYRYFLNIRQKHNATYKNVSDVYQAIFAPGFFPLHSDATVWYRAPSDNYEQNKDFDVHNKGYITRGDATSMVSRASCRDGYRKALAELNAVAGRNYKPNLVAGTVCTKGKEYRVVSSSSSLPMLALLASGFLYYRHRVAKRTKNSNLLFGLFLLPL